MGPGGGGEAMMKVQDSSVVMYLMLTVQIGRHLQNQLWRELGNDVEVI